MPILGRRTYTITIPRSQISKKKKRGALLQHPYLTQPGRPGNVYLKPNCFCYLASSLLRSPAVLLPNESGRELQGP
jgi:hypothetical protein